MALSSLGPGFRFHPTDVELVMYYLKKKLSGKKLIVEAIAEVNIYDFSPWDLPDKSNLRSRDLEYFFFCPKSRKYSSGSRVNRATEIGFWKATGKDRPVEYKQRTVAMIKTLVFHLGHAPEGQRTDWVMHEYRMEDKNLADSGVTQDMYVLCKIFKKSGAGPKNGAQYGAPFSEEEWDNDEPGSSTVTAIDDVMLTRLQSALTEPGSSTVVAVDDVMLTRPLSALTGPGSSDVPAIDDVMLTGPQSDLTEPGSSTVDDAVFNVENLASDLWQSSLPTVEVGKEYDGIFDELGNLFHLEDVESRTDYTTHFLAADDDLDVHLRGFYVD